MQIIFNVNKLKHFFHAAIFILLLTKMSAQGVQVGQQCPDIKIGNILNYKSETANLSDFSNKSIVLDFWSSWCSNCIAAFPKLDSLQKQFQNDIQIILVTREHNEKVINLFSQRERLKNIKLVSVIEDTLLSLLFPYRSLPHQVWINKNGVVQAITNSEYATAANLKLLIDDKPLNHLPLKKDSYEYILGSDKNTLIGAEYDENKKKVLFYSYFGLYRPELISGISMPKVNKELGQTRISATNQSVINLYKLAYNLEREPIYKMHDSKIIRMFSDSRKYIPDYTNQTNIFCYELIVGDTSQKNAFNAMQCDLDRYFGIQSTKEKRSIKCFVLRKTSNIDKLKSNRSTSGYIDNDSDSMIVSNILFQLFVPNNFASMLPLPLIDETNYEGKVDMKLPGKFKDLRSFNEALARYNLLLDEDNRIMNVIILKDKQK